MIAVGTIVLVGLVVGIAMRGRSDDTAAKPRDAAGAPPSAGRGTSATTAHAQRGPSDLGWEAPLPSEKSKSARARRGVRRSVRVDAQLVAVTSNSESEIVKIETFNRLPVEARSRREERGEFQSIYVEPGGVLALSSSSPALAFQRVLVRVPDPVPNPLVVSVPSSRHPREARPLVLAVVDEESLAPVIGARLEWGDPSAARASVAAGADGLIEVSEPSERPSEVRRRLLSSEARATVSARGHYAAVPGAKERMIWSPELDDLAAWAAGGPLRVRLVRTPTPMPLRRFRLVDAKGSPFADRAVRILHPNFGPPPWNGVGGSDGWRRADGNGTVEVCMPVFVGIEVAPRDQPTFVFGVHLDRCPADRERTLSIPAIAHVDVHVDDLPPGRQWTWSPNLLGDAATPMDGIFYAGRYDEGVVNALRASASPFDFPEVREEGGKLDPRSPSFRFSTYVGCRRRVFFIGADPGAAFPDQYKVGSFEVEPTREGVEERSIRWGDLDH